MMPAGSLAHTPQPPRLCSGFSRRPVRQIFINWLLVEVGRLQTVLNLGVTGSPRRPIPSEHRRDAGRHQRSTRAALVCSHLSEGRRAEPD